MDHPQSTAEYGGEAEANSPESVTTATLDDIKIIYHPSSNRQTDNYSFEFYCSAPTEQTESTVDPANSSGTSMEPDSNKRPWHPFPTRTDFELAEVMLDAHLNRGQIERILSIIWKAMNGSENSNEATDRVTIQNTADLDNIWDHALRAQATGVFNLLTLEAYTLLIVLSVH